MKNLTESMMDYCELFDTEEEAIAACRDVNRGLSSKVFWTSRSSLLISV